MTGKFLKSFNAFPVILLAAGNSTRMGQPKGLLEYQGRSWLETQLLALQETGLQRAILILGVHAQSYVQMIDQSPRLNLSISTHVNPHPELGPFSSIQIGLEEVIHRTTSNGVFILPLDVPVPSTDVWIRLAKALDPSVRACTPAHDTKGGHPALLSLEFAKQLAALDLNDPNARLDRQIHLLPPIQWSRVQVADWKTNLNLNTPHEWQSFKNAT